MEFSFSEEQEMIRESADAFLSEVSTGESIRQVMATELGYDPEVWRRMCEELVWPALHIPENFGGMDLSYTDLVILLEKMGEYLLCSPFYSTVCLAANALLLNANDEQKQRYLTQIAEGSLTATLAYTNSNEQWSADCISASYQQKDNNYIINGDYRFVANGHSADLIIVAAKTDAPSNSSTTDNNIALFAIDANTKGLTRTYTASMDQTKKLASLQLNNVILSSENMLGQNENAWPILQQVLQLAAIATSAEQLGGIQKSLDSTVEYTKERVQFNRSIASFQAVKHKAADMMVKAEGAKSAVYYAACIADEFFQGSPLGEELAEAASLAKAYCSDAYFFNSGTGIQLHGGVGFTWEYDIQLHFKRAKSTESWLGNGASHRENIASMLLD